MSTRRASPGVSCMWQVRDGWWVRAFARVCGEEEHVCYRQAHAIKVGLGQMIHI